MLNIKVRRKSIFERCGQIKGEQESLLTFSFSNTGDNSSGVGGMVVVTLTTVVGGIVVMMKVSFYRVQKGKGPGPNFVNFEKSARPVYPGVATVSVRLRGPD